MTTSRPTLSTTVRSGAEVSTVAAWAERSMSDPAVLLSTSAAHMPLTPTAARLLARALDAAADVADGADA